MKQSWWNLVLPAAGVFMVAATITVNTVVNKYVYFDKKGHLHEIALQDQSYTWTSQQQPDDLLGGSATSLTGI